MTGAVTNRLLWVGAGLAMAVAGCSAPVPSAAPTGPPVGSASAVAGSIDPQLLQPLAALGPCELSPSPVPASERSVAGLHLPPEAIVVEVQDAGPATNVRGYVPMTPVQLRVHYQRRDDLRKLLVEDEIRESEVLATDGTYRQFVKAQAVCRLGSLFVAVIAPESAADAVPTPSGNPGP